MNKTIVIKIGSSILMTKRNKLDEFRISHIAQQVADLESEGVGVILVVSGAVASGFNFIQFKGEPILKQAVAGIGQAVLTSTFQNIFSSKGMQIAQILLSDENYLNRNLKDLLLFYAEAGIVPMINENDVIALNSFGGNDILASKIALLINADKLLIMSTFDKSLFGVGGGETKKQALEIMEKQKIAAKILNGKDKNTIMEAML